MYSPLNIDENDDIVEFTKKAFANLNIEGKTASTGGGSDTNVLNKNGVKAVNLGIKNEEGSYSRRIYCNRRFN